MVKPKSTFKSERCLLPCFPCNTKEFYFFSLWGRNYWIGLLFQILRPLKRASREGFSGLQYWNMRSVSSWDRMQNIPQADISSNLGALSKLAKAISNTSSYWRPLFLTWKTKLYSGGGCRGANTLQKTSVGLQLTLLCSCTHFYCSRLRVTSQAPWPIRFSNAKIMWYNFPFRLCSYELHLRLLSPW